MASPASVLNKTLQNITFSKIRELEALRKSYESRKREYLAKADAAATEQDRLACLLDAVKELYPPASKDDSLSNIQRWLDQSRYDASIPESKLVSFSQQLRSKLDIQSRKLDMALLYSRLLTEWMDQPVSEPLPASVGDADDDSFELIERQRQRLSELVDKFEAVVFEPFETNEVEIRGFLDRLFPDEESQKELAKLRKTISEASEKFMAEKAPFNLESLTSCIKGLLTEDILSDEKQAILRDFLDSDVAKSEIADVLNMRFSDLKEWHWDAGEEGIRVMPRRGLNGKYRIWADDDILQMLFVQYIGIRLCNLLKPALKSFMRAIYSRNHDGHMVPSPAELERRRYYLGGLRSSSNNIEQRRRDEYFEKFFLSQLPATETSLFDGDHKYDDDSDDDRGLDAQDFNKLLSSPQKRSGIKQQLLRRLTAELLVHRLRGVTHDTRSQPGGGVAIVQTDLQWYATALPHSTVYAVMRYVGFGEDWIHFFKKYLAAPLNLDKASDDRPQKGPRIRQRGVPMAHSSEKFTGELVLFFMDLAVHRETGIFLYRLHDDIWLFGEPKSACKAWTCLQSFVKVFGLDLNKSKTGSVYLPGAGKKDTQIAQALPDGPVSIGFLTLDPETGKWTINQKLVQAHVDQLKKQLAESKSVLAWVQTWNSCIGRFFSHTFGEPAECFGREHINEVLNTYTNMLKRLFPQSDGKEGSAVEYVKRMIQDRFGVSDLPDSFIFLPEALGGLGLRNPFINLFLVRNEVDKTPEELIHEYLQQEREQYLGYKKEFDNLRANDNKALLRRLQNIYPGEELQKQKAIPEDQLHTFLSLEEFSRYRERQDTHFCRLYDRLVSVPVVEEIVLSKDVQNALLSLCKDGKWTLDAEKKWFLQLYSEELFQQFGGLSLVDKQFLPVGVLAMMRGKKVSWNMVL